MRAIAATFVGLAAGCGIVALVFDIAGDLDPIYTLFLVGGVCCAIAAPLFFIDDHRRRKRATPRMAAPPRL
jgi:hypothetical protein